MPTKHTHPAKVILLGGIILDRYFEVDRYPEAGKDTLIQRSFDRVGGCSLNVAVTLKNLGSLPYIVNQFGADEIGAKIEQYIRSLALPTACMWKAPGRQTGYCLTILDRTGERTFFTYRGCEGEFSPQKLRPEWTTGFAFAYLTGYYLLNRQTASAVLELVGQLRQNGCQVVFDPGALICEMDPSQLRELLRRSDWFVPNSNELVMIEEMLPVSGNLISWLFDQGMRGVVVKKGSQGVDIYPPTSGLTLNSVQVKAIDTTGAGDSFAGGLIHGLANGYPLPEAAILANACGAFTTTIEGPHGVFSLEELSDFISSYKDKNS